MQVSTRPHLKVHRRKLLSGARQPGTPVHAASFIRRREIVLESQLLAHPGKLKLVLVHELFHFVWPRLGNQRRHSFAALLTAELAAHAKGEIGESAAGAKPGPRKNYVCESFCDTAAWLYAGVEKSPDFALALRWQKKRKAWFEANFP